MSDATRPQTWEIVNENSLDALETVNRESLDNLLEILNSKVNFPFRISLSGTVLTVHESELQTFRSDGTEWGNTEDSFKYATAPIDGQYKKLIESTLDLLDGSDSGDFAPGISITCPTLSAGDFIWLGFEAKSSGDIGLVWGNPEAVLTTATYPTFTGTAICMMKLQASTGTVTPAWGDFEATVPSDIIVFKGSGGGSGGAGANDFVPIYKSSSEYRLQNTQGRSTRFNEQYFSVEEDLDFSYDLGMDKLWYICIDTDQVPGIITAINKDLYIVETDLDPNSPSFPQNLVVLGYYEVVGGGVTQQNLGTFSPRSVDTFVGDLTASYENATSYRIQSSRGRLVRANNKYFYLNENDDLVKSFTPSPSGTWYICLDTSGDGGEITSTHLKETQLSPSEISFPQHYAPLAKCDADSGTLDFGTFKTVSDREINTLQGDFVPSYLDNDTFVINHTFGRKVKLLSEYFYRNTNLEIDFSNLGGIGDPYDGKSEAGLWYIVVDTADIIGAGELQTEHIKFTMEDPTGPSFDPDFVALGEYVVDSFGDIDYTTFIPYSVAGAGAAGSSGDFVPLYFDATSFSIRSTVGKKVNFNNKYYFTNEELNVDYDLSASGTWYISVDTDQASGEVTQAAHADYIVMSQIPPYTALSNPYSVAIGQYTVDSSLNVDKETHEGYSIREHTTWMNGIPNIWKKSEEKYSSANAVTLSHGFGQVPDLVTFKYWDNSVAKFINLYSIDLEQYRTKDDVVYNIPDSSTHPVITWDLGDYFLVEAIKYAYTQEGGFASPKTDYATDWYSTTPSSTVAHPLATRPQNISLEFVDLSGTPIYYIEDGLIYVDKNTGGIDSSAVTFDWSPFGIIPIVLSSTLKMRIHFNVSKISAGAFEANKNERGTVSITGDSSKVISPDLILTSLDTDFATTINGMGPNTSVLVTETIYITSEQNITNTGVSFNMLPGTYITSVNGGLASFVRFSGDDYEVENIRIMSQEDNISGLRLDADGIVKSVLVKQDAVGKALDLGVLVGTGAITTIFGRAKAINGTITDKFDDVDSNSEITVS